MRTLQQALAAQTGAKAVLTSDAVATHVGALGGRGGVTVAAGTGAIVIAENSAGDLYRVDGWGHLLGDAGSGAAIGRRALEVALEQFDGRRTDAQDLLEQLRTTVGDPPTWPRVVYESPQRAALFASLVPTVLALVDEGDVVARGLVDAAVQELDRSVKAGLAKPGVARRVALSGGLFSSARLRQSMVQSLAGVEIVGKPGDALEGALILAARAMRDDRRPAGSEQVTW